MLDLWGNEVQAPEPTPPPAPRDQADHAAEWERLREQARERERRRWRSGNPLVRTLGLGPEGATCKGCCHLLRLDYHDGRYIKCELRGVTHGTATDHRVKWPACARYDGGSDGGRTH
jgi:hypothetical protein